MIFPAIFSLISSMPQYPTNKQSRIPICLVALCLILFLQACAPLRGAGLSARDMTVNFVKAPSSSVGAEPLSSKRSGIFTDAGSLFIKTRGKSFLSVLDEAARLRRFNYTILTDVSKFYIDYFDLDVATAKRLKFSAGISDQKIWADQIKQQKFSSVDDFVRASVLAIKEAYGSSDDAELRDAARNLRYKWTGDGFVFYSVKKNQAETKTIDPSTEGYKKIFLFNLSEREVSFYLARLLNIPYADFSPNKPADLPRRNSSAMQLLGQGVQYQDRSSGDTLKLQPSDWQLNSQTANGVANPADDYSNVRWISIPQQNALIVKGKASVLDKISEILHAVDSDYKQIVIEAKIFQYSVNTSKKMGLALDAIAGRLDISSKLGDVTTFTVNKIFGTSVANGLPANFYNLPATERRYALLSALTLYGSDGLVRITAEPRILLKPGQVSTIDLTTTKLVQAAESGVAGASVAPPVQVEAGIFFTVKPTLLSDNKIQLDMFLKQSDFSSGSEKNVLISTNQNQLSTSVVASHNELISLGGLERKTYQLGNTGIPGLKDAPLIGNAFGSTGEEGASIRVEFMIRAYIHQLDDQLSAPVKSVDAINCRINKLVNERLGGPVDKVECLK
jgi:hypothetical protein